MPEKHLRQHRFTYSTSGQFTRNKTRIQKFREKIESRYTYRNEIYKVFVSRIRWHTEISKIYQEEWVSDKVLRDKAFEISSKSHYSGYQDGITSTINNSLIRGLETPLLTHRLELFLMINN